MTDDVNLQEDEEEEFGSKATPAELLTKVRAGDNEAAYELLGRQAPVKAWRDALGQLAKTPDQADLEQAAHRSLRRPPEVVSALLDLGRRRDPRRPRSWHVPSRSFDPSRTWSGEQTSFESDC